MINTSIDASTRRRDELALWVGLAVCMAVGPMMLYTLTAVSPLVIADLDLSPAQYGTISGVTFGSAALAALALGGPSSRLSGRAVMVAVSIGSAIGLALLAAATSYALVLAAAVVCGAAQSLSNPATNRVVAGLPAQRRGALIGWKQSGVQMAQLTAGLTAPAIAAATGWRWAAVVGVAVGALGVASALAIRVGESTPAPAATDRIGNHPSSVGTLTAYTFFMGFGLQATNAYLPLFAHRRLGFDVTTAGLTAAVIGLVGVVSRIWWGRRSDRDGASAASLLTLALASAAGVALALAATVTARWVLWIGAGVFGAAALASNSVTMVALVRSVPASALGAATGLLVTGMYVGFATGPLGFGLALDHGVGFDAAWLLPLTSFGIAALIGASLALPRTRH